MFVDHPTVREVRALFTRKPAAPAAAGHAPAARSGASSIGLQRLVAGVNPLLGAADVLLALIAQLRATMRHADPAGLQRQLIERVKEFEADARAAGVERPKIVAARYVLCAFIDETVEATPWGASGAWAQHNLLQEFHDERAGGDKAFKLLERLGEDLAANREVLELFYVCLALGFEGRYRGTPNGRAQLDAIAARLADALRPPRSGGDAQAPRTLALRWTGANARGKRALKVLPLWVVFALGAGVVLAALLWLSARLDAQGAPAFRQIHAAAAALRSVPAAAPLPVRPRLVPMLRADLADGLLDVRDEPMRSIVMLPADTLFAAGSAQIEPRSAEVVARIARALAPLRGQIVVSGHTDNVPVNSLQFPSSWHLARERARAVAELLAQHGALRKRLRAEGRADAEPLAPNDNAAGRARNRRIEIELLLPRPDYAVDAPVK
jgi:type VI secretion system protein ImpK